jgi:hypothetical protein
MCAVFTYTQKAIKIKRTQKENKKNKIQDTPRLIFCISKVVWKSTIFAYVAFFTTSETYSVILKRAIF